MPIIVLFINNCLQCSTSCGTGVQSRLYQCVNDNGKPISDIYCEGRNKKANRPCAQQSCPRWGLGSWTPVSSVH